MYTNFWVVKVWVAVSQMTWLYGMWWVVGQEGQLVTIHSQNHTTIIFLLSMFQTSLDETSLTKWR